MQPVCARIHELHSGACRRDRFHWRAQADLDPKLAVAYFYRGSAYGAKGDPDRAIADFNEVIRLDPNHAQALNGRCYTLAIIGQMQQALADCNESLRLLPNDANALDSRGFAYLKLGQLDAAITDYDSVLKLHRTTASSLYGRGVAKLKNGDSSGGNSDIAAAKAIQANIDEEFARDRGEMNRKGRACALRSCQTRSRTETTALGTSRNVAAT